MRYALKRGCLLKLLKLAFVRLETGDKEKAKAACERILTSYGDSRAASQARTLLNAI